jgi:hypothetical protein
MRDDFNALDFLSCGGFRFSAQPDSRPKKKRFGLRRKKVKAKRKFPKLFPFHAGKKAARSGSLEGWPVTLSWPTHDLGGDAPEFRDFTSH